jgi:trans-2,3-dihydro-3-hydroxyanthranilate isomerase
LKSVEALGRIAIDVKKANQYFERCDAKFAYFITPAGVDGASARPKMRARMIFYNGEDPATGSAAGCCAAWMVRHGVAKRDEQVLIEQGVEMKRRSHLYVRAGKSTEGDRIVNVRVGGNVVEVMQGEVFL